MRNHRKNAELLQLAEFDFDAPSEVSVAEHGERAAASLEHEAAATPSDPFVVELWGLATVLADLSYHGALRPRLSGTDIPDGAVDAARAILACITIQGENNA